MPEPRPKNTAELPVRIAPEDRPSAGLFTRLQEVGKSTRAVGELLEDPEKMTLGELQKRLRGLLRLLGL